MEERRSSCCSMHCTIDVEGSRRNCQPSSTSMLMSATITVGSSLTWCARTCESERGSTRPLGISHGRSRGHGVSRAPKP